VVSIGKQSTTCRSYSTGRLLTRARSWRLKYEQSNLDDRPGVVLTVQRVTSRPACRVFSPRLSAGSRICQQFPRPAFLTAALGFLSRRQVGSYSCSSFRRRAGYLCPSNHAFLMVFFDLRQNDHYVTGKCWQRSSKGLNSGWHRRCTPGTLSRCGGVPLQRSGFRLQEPLWGSITLTEVWQWRVYVLCGPESWRSFTAETKGSNKPSCRAPRFWGRMRTLLLRKSRRNWREVGTGVV